MTEEPVNGEPGTENRERFNGALSHSQFPVPGSRFTSSTRRTLVVLLLLPSLALADPPALPPTRLKSGHTTQMVAAATASFAIVTIALAFVGYASFVKLDKVVQNDLKQLANDNQGLLGNPDVAAWFATPTCTPPDLLMGMSVQQFKDDCNGRSRWITASVVLFAITGTLLVTAAVTEGIGLWQDAQAFKQIQLTPEVSRNGAGATLTLRF